MSEIRIYRQPSPLALHSRFQTGLMKPRQSLVWRENNRGISAVAKGCFVRSRVQTGGVRMPIVDAVKACFRKYADFSGRATRTEYWWFFLAVLLGSAVAWLISLRIYTLFSVVTLLPMIAVGARRLHDTNRSGWWQLLALVPFGVVVPLILLAQRSTPIIPTELPARAQR